jgi:hypothetical protein
MSTRKRVQAICLLAVGSIATIASAIRAYYVWHLFHASADQSWNAFPIYFLSDLEIVLGIVSTYSSLYRLRANRMNLDMRLRPAH